ncbi:MAG: ATP-binding protein, partial [Bacteroidota bacterium]
KLNVAKENLHLMVQAAPYALAISNKDGSILDVNKKAEQLFGYNEGEMIGRSVSSLVPENMREMWMQRRGSFLNDPETSSYSLDDEIMVMRKNGTLFPIEIVLTPIHTDQGVRILSFVIDITARRANEQTIKRQVIELQHKNEELEQFNYISSHDLQEPLRTVSNYIEMLQEDYPEQIHGEVKEHLQSIDSAVSRMLKLVRSLLEFGKLGQDRKMSFIDSQMVINHVLADLKGLIEANNATVLVKGELPKLYAYETELRQLLQNLINNAVKFKKKETPPQITISCKSIDGYFRFAIADNGIGIAPEHKAKIFNIFQRLHKQDVYEGHGIGLANCKKIAELHGGKIWVQSEPDIGSTFKFTVLKLKL